MKALPERKPPVSYSVDLLNLDAELTSPKIIALIEQGYRIKAVVPVEDNGKPVAILLLQYEDKPHNTTTALYIICMLLGAILAASISIALHLFTV